MKDGVLDFECSDYADGDYEMSWMLRFGDTVVQFSCNDNWRPDESVLDNIVNGEDFRLTFPDGLEIERGGFYRDGVSFGVPHFSVFIPYENAKSALVAMADILRPRVPEQENE